MNNTINPWAEFRILNNLETVNLWGILTVNTRLKQCGENIFLTFYFSVSRYHRTNN